MEKSRALHAIVSAGLIAGILDITSAFVIAELKGRGSIRMLQGIASGLLGAPSFEGGMATAGLGLVIHFFIALTAASVFYLGSRQFSFLTRTLSYRDWLTDLRSTFSCIGSSCRSDSRARTIPFPGM